MVRGLLRAVNFDAPFAIGPTDASRAMSVHPDSVKVDAKIACATGPWITLVEALGGR